jgi:hypothetical protein
MANAGFLMGEFPLAHIGIFDFRGRDFGAKASYHGLHLNETVLIAHLVRKSDGQHIHFVRPMMLYTSSGVTFGTSRADGGIYQDPRMGQFLRGGIFSRTIDEDDALSLISSTGFWSGGVPFSVEARFGDTAEWQDSGNITLRGRALGPSMQTYVASRRDDQGVGV